MAGVSLPDMRPWGRQPLTIPPTSARTWLSLAVWELWMGLLLGAAAACGVILIVTAPHHVVTISDLTNCYAPPPVALPCERTLYQGGLIYVAFSALCGVMLLGVAAWFLWELWSASEPKPITDEFLKLLDARRSDTTGAIRGDGRGPESGGPMPSPSPAPHSASG